MQAMVCAKFGPAEGLELREIEKPAPRDNEVLIRVRATTVTAGDCELRSLKVPLAFRLPMLIYFGTMRGGAPILGQELAGEIEAVGKDVRRFKAGDAVYAAAGLGLGTYAEYKCMPAEPGGVGGALAIKPANLTFAEAATIPVGGLEALHFHRLGAIRRGETLLINGACGSIGVMALQLARLAGAAVTAVDSAEKLDTLSALGAEQVLDYQQEDFTRRDETYDVILDVIGKSHFVRSLHRLKPGGRYLLANPSFGQRLRAGRSQPGGRQVIQGTGRQTAEDLLFLKDLLEAGQLKAVVDRTFPLERLAEAHRYVEQGHKKGNVVITV